MQQNAREGSASEKACRSRCGTERVKTKKARLSDTLPIALNVRGKRGGFRAGGRKDRLGRVRNGVPLKCEGVAATQGRREKGREGGPGRSHGIDNKKKKPRKRNPLGSERKKNAKKL